MNVLSTSELDKSEFKSDYFNVIESKIVSEMPKYMNLDISNLIAGFMKLGHVPRDIISTLNE